ncbi:hypothetical protein [Botrimarina sp.]|uniref:hypothetical protein n=1 Tax=Botrimarina sp. TaxID=2795802 RepID=UPI0032EC8768
MKAIPRTRVLLTAAACTGLAAAALAQPPGRGGPGGGIGGLLRSDEVRSELDITDSQAEELRTLESEMRDKMRDQFRQMRSGGEVDRDAMREQFQQMREEAEQRVAGVLSTTQMDRLKQINLQQQLDQGTGRALMGGPLAEELNLSQEQQTQLREKLREVQAELDEKIREAREAARQELLTVLTSEQRSKLDSMLGEPFAMSEQDGPRFGRGGDRPPRGPRGFGRGDRRGPPPGGPEGRRGRPGPPPPPPGGEPEL